MQLGAECNQVLNALGVGAESSCRISPEGVWRGMQSNYISYGVRIAVGALV